MIFTFIADFLNPFEHTIFLAPPESWNRKSTNEKRVSYILTSINIGMISRRQHRWFRRAYLLRGNLCGRISLWCVYINLHTRIVSSTVWSAFFGRVMDNPIPASVRFFRFFFFLSPFLYFIFYRVLYDLRLSLRASVLTFVEWDNG